MSRLLYVKFCYTTTSVFSCIIYPAGQQIAIASGRKFAFMASSSSVEA